MANFLTFLMFAGKRKEKFDDTGASFCTKLVFFVLFFSFTLTTSLFLMDYKKGQLEQMTSSLPPEVLQAAEKVGKIGAEVLDKVRAFNTQVLLKVEELSRKVPIGDKTLADYIFFRKMQQVSETFEAYVVVDISFFRIRKRLKNKQRKLPEKLQLKRRLKLKLKRKLN